MGKQADEFSRYLSALRRARGLSAHALSRKIGKSNEYIGGWERYARPINRKSLQAICEALDLEPHERTHLLHLADRRLGVTPPSAALQWPDALYANARDVLGTRLRADSSLSLSDVRLSLDAASWAIVHYIQWYVPRSADGTSISPYHLRWPAKIVALGLIDSQLPDEPWVPTIDDGIVQAEIPDLASIESVHATNAESLADGIMRCFRRWLFTRPDILASAVRDFQSVTIAMYSPEVGPVLSIDFDQESAGFARVRPQIVYEVYRREALHSLRMFNNSAGPRVARRTGLLEAQVLDSYLLATFCNSPVRPPYRFTPSMSQNLRDAYFITSSLTWKYEHAPSDLIYRAIAAAAPQYLQQIAQSKDEADRQLREEEGYRVARESIRAALATAPSRMSREHS